jgi:membrane-bound lytic murein transglycosylase D
VVAATVAPIAPPDVVVASLETTEEESDYLDELASSVLDGDFAAALLGTLQTALLSDPSDYSVAADNTIEVHPLETLGHYADWLGIRTQRLRDINGLAFRTPVEVGNRIRLDLGTIDAKTFEDRRVDFHRKQQDAFFREHVITGVTEHVISSGESIWILSLRKYDVPVWLFRQYNPGLDTHNVQSGTIVQFPVLTSRQ